LRASRPRSQPLPASSAVIESEDGTTTTAAAAPRRQQPKRQTKAQRQSGGASSSAPADESEPKTSLSKSDEPEDTKPSQAAGDAKQATPKPGSAGRSKAQSGQRKGGPQRPKSPSKK